MCILRLGLWTVQTASEEVASPCTSDIDHSWRHVRVACTSDFAKRFMTQRIRMHCHDSFRRTATGSRARVSNATNHSGRGKTARLTMQSCLGLQVRLRFLQAGADTHAHTHTHTHTPAECTTQFISMHSLLPQVITPEPDLAHVRVSGVTEVQHNQSSLRACSDDIIWFMSVLRRAMSSSCRLLFLGDYMMKLQPGPLAARVLSQAV